MIQAFINTPWYGQFMISFVMLFFFFVFIIWLKEAIIRNRWENNAIAKIVFYPLASIFWMGDVAFNVFYAPWMFLERANKYNEGWLLTSRLKYHIKEGKKDLVEGREPSWRFKLSAWLCSKFLEPVDQNHCGLKY